VRPLGVRQKEYSVPGGEARHSVGISGGCRYNVVAFSGVKPTFREVTAMFERYGNLRAARRGFSLVEILVVCVLLVALGGGLAYFYMGHGRGEKPGDIVHTPITKANDAVCQSNISQVRQALSMAQMSESDGKFPRSLTELKELPGEFLSCPTGHEPYLYDPATGQVHCVHPGHENY
jgi:hypothetical protein